MAISPCAAGLCSFALLKSRELRLRFSSKAKKAQLGRRALNPPPLHFKELPGNLEHPSCSSAISSWALLLPRPSACDSSASAVWGSAAAALPQAIAFSQEITLALLSQLISCKTHE